MQKIRTTTQQQGLGGNMKNLKGACVFAQSGGPTAVINSSAAGVFLEALKQPNITAVYGAEHGIRGILDERMFDMSKEDIHELELLKNTPSSALGSVRYKLPPLQKDDTDYKRILEVFKKFNIRYFFYNGGNDSMDTCNKISKFLNKSGWDCNVIGVPKTIDNDLFGTDHCPGYASAAKYISTTLMEIGCDAKVYDTGIVAIIEIMGRNAGWLTAAASLAKITGFGPDLIYLPEVPFSVEDFVRDVKSVMAKNKNKCFVAVSEGIKDKDGRYIGEFQKNMTDLFGHAQLGGVGNYLGAVIKNEVNVKVRAIELSLMQRCAAHVASRTDIDEAFLAGQMAVKYATYGETDKMVVFDCNRMNGYNCVPTLMPLELAANTEKTIPLEWLTESGKGVTQDFIDYALPLIQGEPNVPCENGLPRYAHLKKILAKVD